MVNKELLRYRVFIRGVLGELDELYNDKYEELELTPSDSKVLDGIFDVYHACEKALLFFINAENNTIEKMFSSTRGASNLASDSGKGLDKPRSSNPIEVFFDENGQADISEGWYLGKVKYNAGSFFIYPFRVKLPIGLKGRISLKDK
jgi:hypothetical protein